MPNPIHETSITLGFDSHAGMWAPQKPLEPGRLFFLLCSLCSYSLSLL